MRRFAFALFLVVAAGCAPIGGYSAGPHDSGDSPPDPADSSDIRGAAAQFAKAYPAVTAAALRKVADDCPNLKGWGDFQDAVQEATQDARQKAQEGFNQAMTERLNPKDSDWDAGAAAKALRDAADGFDGGKAGKQENNALRLQIIRPGLGR